MIQAYPVLRQRMNEYGISGRELAAVAQMSVVAFYLKIWGIKQWTLTEVVRICGFFRTTDAENLFLRNNYKSLFRKNQEFSDKFRRY